jgi:hypothetical protein
MGHQVSKKLTSHFLLTSSLLLADVTQTTPYLNVAGDYSTFMKIFNNATCNIKVDAVVFGDNGASNTNSSVINYTASIEPQKTQLLWASDLKSKATALGVTLGNAFGTQLNIACTDGSTLNAEDVITVVVQKSPEGQRVMPVSEASVVDSGAKIIPYVSQSANYITFIKVMNTSSSAVEAVIKAYPDATGMEHTMNQSFPPNQVTLLWATDLASTMGITDNNFAVEISATAGLSDLSLAAVQKTSNGPRVIEVFTSGVN